MTFFFFFWVPIKKCSLDCTCVGPAPYWPLGLIPFQLGSNRGFVFKHQMPLAHFCLLYVCSSASCSRTATDYKPALQTQQTEIRESTSGGYFVKTARFRLSICYLSTITTEQRCYILPKTVTLRWTSHLPNSWNAILCVFLFFFFF